MNASRTQRSYVHSYALGIAAALSAIGIVWLAVWLWSHLTSSIDAACLDACSTYPVPLSWLHSAPIVVVGLISALAIISLAFIVGSITRHLLLSRRLDEEMASLRSQWPAKLRKAVRGLPVEEKLVCFNDSDVYAFCHGYLRPKVFVSRGLVKELSVDELRAVLAHEAEHARRWDPMRLLLSKAVSRGLFFLPIVGEMQRRLAVKVEIAADDSAVRETSVYFLASALRKMLLASGGRATVAPAIGSLDAIKERIRHLSGGAQNSPGISSSAAVRSIVVVVAIVAISLAASAGSAWAMANQPVCCSGANQSKFAYPCHSVDQDPGQGTSYTPTAN